VGIAEFFNEGEGLLDGLRVAGFVVGTLEVGFFDGATEEIITSTPS